MYKFLRLRFPALLLFCIFSVTNTNILKGNPVIINKEGTYFFSANSWSFYATTEKNISPEKIFQLFKKDSFQNVNASVFNGGIPKKYFWFHFSIQNNDTNISKLIIEIQSPRINELELFEMHDDSIVSLGKNGDFYAFDQRKFFYKNFLYPVELNKSATKDYFLFVNQVGQTFILPVEIYKEKEFQKSVNKNYLVDGITYGVLIFVSIFSFIFFINTRHKLYLYYSLYIFSSVIWFLSYYGLGFQVLWPGFVAANTFSSPLMAALNLILGIQISQNILSLKDYNIRLYLIGNVMKVLLLLVAIYPLFINLNLYGYERNHNYLIIFLTVIIVSIAVQFLSLIQISIKGSLAAKFYLLASILKLLSITNLALLELGITPGFYHMEKQLQFGILLEITLLTFALSKRYANYRNENYQKIIEAQERERFSVAKEIHDGISSALTGIRYKLATIIKSQPSIINDLENINNQVAIVQRESRDIAHNLMPEYIKDFELAEAIETYINTIQLQLNNKNEISSSLSIHFLSNKQQHKFSELIKLNIFRIMQELISNILKHSNASKAEVILHFGKNELIIITADNGEGLQRDFDNDNLKGMGLKNIESRVSILNGKIFFSNKMRAEILQKMPYGNEVINDLNGATVIIQIPLKGKMKTTEANNEF